MLRLPGTNLASRNDIEMRTEQQLHESRELRKAFFGTPRRPVCARRDPNIYYVFLRARVEDFFPSHFAPALSVLGYAPAQTSIVNALDLARRIATIVKDEFTSVTTIDSIASSIYAQFAIDASIQDFPKRPLRLVIFTVLGWMTMLYMPSRTIVDDFCIVEPQIQHVRILHQSIDQASKRLCRFLGGFGDLFPSNNLPTSTNSTDNSTVIYASAVNFFSLLSIGKISVLWVHTLSAHLRFNEARELMIFRYPSFCLAMLEESDEICGFKRLFLEHDASAKFATPAVFLREVLYSYRVLFGQDKKSRKLFRSQLLQSAAKDNSYDPLLSSLCGKKTIIYDDTFDQAFPKRSVYSIVDDFPILGTRWLEVQAYNQRQNPSSLSEFWHDRRNPFNFYTFWAVIIVGGISIILSVIQCALSGAQLGAAWKQLEMSNPVSQPTQVNASYTDQS